VRDQEESVAAGRAWAGSPTIDDVAQLAAVSRSTVSRVINDDARVSEATRHAVTEAIRLLEYSPDAAAQRLARRRPRFRDPRASE